MVFESTHVQRHVCLSHHVLDDIHRKPEGVVKLEDQIAGHLFFAGGVEIREGVVEQLESRIQGLGKTQLFVFDHIADKCGRITQLGISRLHDLENGLGGFGEKGLHQADVPAVSDGTPHDAAQHVTASFVGRQHTVAHQKCGGPAVVGDHLHGHIHIMGLPVSFFGQFFGTGDDRSDQIAFKIGLLVLKDRSKALKAQTSVNAGFGQWRHVAFRVPVVLHEDQVPNFQESVAVAIHTAIRLTAAVGITAIQVNLAAGAARSCVAHGPKILFFTQPDHSFVGNTNLFVPQIIGFIVICINRSVEFLRRQAITIGHQVPGKIDCLFFKVVPEGEIPEHFEKGMVSGRIPDVLQVVVLSAGPDTLLGSCGANILPLFFSEEGAFELNHSRIGEQKGWIVLGNQGRAAYDSVVVFFEIIEIDLTNFVACHCFCSMLIEAISKMSFGPIFVLAPCSDSSTCGGVPVRRGLNQGHANNQGPVQF